MLTFAPNPATFYRRLAAWGLHRIKPITELLTRRGGGDLSARDAFVPFVYDELRRIARHCLAGRSNGDALQPTALVRGGYLRPNASASIKVRDRVHFFSLSARMMRQILIDHARQFAAAKRGGNAITVALNDAPDPVGEKANLDLIALNDAMVELENLDSRQCKIVGLRSFGGLTIEETAEAIDISPANAKREWATARLWLHRAMNSSPAP